MTYNIEHYNTIAAALGATETYQFNIQALNFICTALGATSGHTYEIQAWNAINIKMGGSGGYAFTITAMNATIVLSGGAGGYAFEVAALGWFASNGFVPVFTFQPVVEDKVRVANYDYSATFAGTPVYVDAAMADDTGNGLSWVAAKKYIQSGYGASGAGSIINIKAGTYDVKDGALGYVNMGTAKSVMFLGSTSDYDDTIITQSVAAGTGVFRRSAGAVVVFKNLTIQTAATNNLVYEDSGTSDAATIFDNVHLKLDKEGGIQSCYVSTDFNHTKNRVSEFVNCFIESKSETIYIPNISPTQKFHISNCTLKNSYPGYRVLGLINGTGGCSVYDSTFEQGASYYIFQAGTDTAANSDTMSLIDIRGCDFKYAVNKYGHAVCIGRGVTKLYFVNNKVTTPDLSAQSSNICITNKSLSESLADYIMKGNWLKGSRPIVSTGEYMDIQNNVIIQTSSTYPAISLVNNIYNVAVDYNTQHCKIENNIVYSPSIMILLAASQTAEPTKTSILTGTLTSNKYCTNTGEVYLRDNVTDIAFADRVTYWGSAFDNSLWFTGVTQP